MLLDERSSRIFKEIVLHPGITTKQLGKKLNLSRSQIDYGIKKINDWLKLNSFEEKVKRLKTGSIQIDESLRNYHLQNFLNEDRDKIDYIPNQDERAQLIILILLSSKESLSLFHFIADLQVSKNTVLRDLRNVKTLLKNYDLKLSYSRNSGYYLQGHETNIRKLLNDTVANIYKMPYGEKFLQKYGEIKPEDIRLMLKKLENVEAYLEVQYSDTKLWTACYALVLILRRIEREQIIEKNYDIRARELSDTKEYEVLNIIIEDISKIPDEEKIYLTLKLLSISMNKLSQGNEDSVNVTDLMLAIREFLDLFEKKAAIELKNRDELASKLFLHLKPAYYRIKYDLTIRYFNIEKFYQEFESVFHLVKEALGPLEKFVGKSFPENEILMISMFIGAQLSSTKAKQKIEAEDYVANAIIVCPSGVITSNLLEKKLEDIFPNICFLNTMSIREFEIYEKVGGNLDNTIIFSTIPLKSNGKVIIIDENIGKIEKESIINSVSAIVDNGKFKGFSVNKIMNIVNSHVALEEEAYEKIKVDLITLGHNLRENVPFYNENTTAAEKRDLSDFLEEGFIQIKDSLSWEEALDTVSLPLIKSGKIGTEYIEAMKNLYPYADLCIDFSGNILIPHARPEDGARDVGFSLLKIKEGLSYKDKKIYLVASVSAIDKEKHINAMFQLLNISGNRTIVKQILEIDSPEEIRKLIRIHQNNAVEF